MKGLDVLLASLAEQEVLSTVDERLKMDDPTKILQDLTAGMQKVGELYSKGEYFLSEMLLATDIFERAMNKIKPKLGQEQKSEGLLVLGTVQGDVHTIGKSIVAAFVAAGGFTVADIGEDVSPERFVEKAKESEPDVIGISCLLTTGLQPMKQTIKLLEDQGLRSKVKILIGGAPISASPELWLREVKADDYGKDAVDALAKVKRLLA